MLTDVPLPVWVATLLGIALEVWGPPDIGFSLAAVVGVLVVTTVLSLVRDASLRRQAA